MLTPLVDPNTDAQFDMAARAQCDTLRPRGGWEDKPNSVGVAASLSLDALILREALLVFTKTLLQHRQPGLVSINTKRCALTLLLDRQAGWLGWLNCPCGLLLLGLCGKRL